MLFHNWNNWNNYESVVLKNMRWQKIILRFSSFKVQTEYSVNCKIMYIFAYQKNHEAEWLSPGWASISKIAFLAQKASFGRSIRLPYLVSNGPMAKLYTPSLRYLIIAIVYIEKYYDFISSWNKILCYKNNFFIMRIY